MTSPQSPVSSRYDVIVAGASFAGLAAAQRSCPASNGAGLRGRVLLLDKDPLGARKTSACGAPLSLVESMGGGAAVQQVHTHIYVHTPAMRAAWLLPEPFCTFDYPRFCELAYARTSAEFRQTAVLGRIGATLHTAAGNESARFLVDATGWRAALVGGPSSPYVNRRWMAFGIETEVTCRFDDGLHFYFIPEIADGYAWVFPCGGTMRIGVLSYLGRSNLRPALDRFLARFGLRGGEIHGGFLASGLRDPVRDGVFVAGDASGQCLPMTGEGIRTAILAGWRCGELIQQVLDGSLSVADATHAYRGFVDRARRDFRALLWGNLALLALPLSMKGRLAAFLSRPGPLHTFMKHYLRIFSGSVLDRPIAATSR